MIKLHCTRFDAGGNPILSDAEIDRYAHALLKDYKPGLLEKPGIINYQHFIETYLGAMLSFQDIYCDDPDKPILGMAVFREGEVKVFDREALSIQEIWVDEHSILLDNLVLENGKEGLARFTALHEARHLLLHSGDYDGIDDYDKGFVPATLSCRRENIESRRRPKCSSHEWKEHQADCFAGCLAIPTATFISFVRKLLREHHVPLR